MGKTCYSYNTNKECIFSGEYETQESPRQKGIYLLPANATWKKPLEEKEGYIVCFNVEQNEWEYKLDISKLIYFDTRTGNIVDEPLREDLIYYTEVKPTYLPVLSYWNGETWVLKLDMLKEYMLRDISYFEDYLSSEGFEIEGYGTIDLNDNTYYTLQELVENAYNKFYDKINFRMKDNTMMDIPTDTMFFAKLNMYNKLQENKLLIFNLKDSIRNATNTTEILNLTIKDLRLLDYVEKYKYKD